MLTEPLVKRAVVFIDGQKLYHSFLESSDYSYPNYDMKALSQRTIPTVFLISPENDHLTGCHSCCDKIFTSPLKGAVYGDLNKLPAKKRSP